MFLRKLTVILVPLGMLLALCLLMPLLFSLDWFFGGLFIGLLLGALLSLMLPLAGATKLREPFAWLLWIPAAVILLILLLIFLLILLLVFLVIFLIVVVTLLVLLLVLLLFLLLMLTENQIIACLIVSRIQTKGTLIGLNGFTIHLMRLTDHTHVMEGFRLAQRIGLQLGGTLKLHDSGRVFLLSHQGIAQVEDSLRVLGILLYRLTV